MANGQTIEQLQIEVGALSTSAEQSLRNLKATMDGLKDACKGGAGLSSISKPLEKLRESLSKFTDSDVERLRQLTEALKSMQGLDKLSISPEIARQIREINNALASGSRNSSLGAETLANKVNMLAGIGLAYKAVSKVGRAIAGFIDKSNAYIENVNLFNASLGEFADEAQEYAEKVGNLMGIDPGAWMRNQGVFQTLATGFGVASDRAYIMSKNLTQLGYDLSSFFNIAVDGEGGAMQKLQAGLSGELEPLRRLGFDLSQARLKAVALSLGIDQTFNSMTQAQKAQLRYYAIMTQVTTAQGDMARTLDTPANQLRILKASCEQAARALGNIFIPALNAILPYVIAAANAIRILANAIASLFGFSMPEVDYSGIEGATGAAEDLGTALGGAGSKAKKTKELLADWDELNIIQSESDSGGGGGGGGSKINPDDWKWDLPEYDFLKGLIGSKVDEIMKGLQPVLDWCKEHIDEILSLALGVGAAIAEWSLAKKFFPSLKNSVKLFDSLLAMAGALLIETATVALNIHFTSDFLTNGNYGSFLAGIGTDTAGSIIVGKLVEVAMKGSKYEKTGGQVALGLSFLINGGVSLDMALTDFREKGFTAENFLTFLKGTAEGGYGAYKVLDAVVSQIFGPNTGKEKRGLGMAAFTATLGTAVNLSLAKGVVENDEVSIGSMLGSLGTQALTAVVTGATIQHSFGEGGWVVGGIVMTAESLLNLSVILGSASRDGEFTDNMLLTAIADSVGLGLGVGALAFGLGASMLAASAIAAGAILITGLAVLAFRVAINDGFKINWGTEELTEEQIKAKIESYFEYDVNAHIKSITAYADDTTTITDNITGKTEEIEKALTGIKLNVDTENSEKAIATALLGTGEDGQGGLLGYLKELVAHNALSVGAFLSADGETSEDDQNIVNILNFINTDVSQELDAIGAQWGEWFANGFEGVTKEEIQETLEYVQELTNAALNGANEADFTINMAELGLKDMTKDSAGRVIAGYKESEAQLFAAYKAQEADAYRSTMSSLKLAEVRLAHMDTNDPKYAEMSSNVELLRAEAERLKTDIENGYKEAEGLFVEAVSGSRAEMNAELVDLFAGSIDISKLKWDNPDVIMAQKNMVDTLFDFSNGTATEADAREKMSTWLLTLMKESMSETDWNLLSDMLDSGLVDIFDLFDDTKLEEIITKEFTNYDYRNLMYGVGEELKGVTDPMREIWELIKKPQEDPPNYETTEGAITGVGNTVTDTAKTVNTGVAGIKRDLASLNGSFGLNINTTFTGGWRPKFAAAGGQFDSGELFVAREAGAEMVGSIGRKTTVANNDQIVEGITAGVSGANQEGNEIMRQMTGLLRVIASKKMTLAPSTALARTVKRSEEMRLAAEGV